MTEDRHSEELEPVDDGRLPRRMEEKANRFAALSLFRAGLSVFDTAKILGMSRTLIDREFKYDPAFRDECYAAMEDPFAPVLAHALKLALDADEAGEKEGAHKALALVLRYYDNLLDRKQKYELTARAMDNPGTTGPRVSMVMGPDATDRVLDRLAGKRDAIETTGRTNDDND